MKEESLTNIFSWLIEPFSDETLNFGDFELYCRGQYNCAVKFTCTIFSGCNDGNFYCANIFQSKHRE